MKRSSLILACLFFILNSSFAQPPFPTGTIGFGGGVGIHNEGGESTSGGSSFDKPTMSEFSIDPKVLYGISPKIQVGVELSFAMEKVEDNYSQTMFGVNLMAENYCDKFSGEVGGIYSTLRGGFATGKWKDESGGDFEQDISKIKAGLNYGAYLNLSPRVKLRTELGGLKWK